MNQYEAYKVNSLVNQYRANPDMFNDDQLDELEQLAEQHQISFKRNTSPFSLTRAMQQASAGFIEGFTTLDLMPKEPRNTGEAIFRQLGHLAGFAPSIMKAPIVGMAKVVAGFTGRKTRDVLKGRVVNSVMNGIDFIGHKSVPMLAQKKTQELFNRGIKKSGADALDYMKRGAKTRAIAEEAVGLAGASAVSSIWKGTDAIIDSFVGGAIAGGAFGGIGNFANLARFHKGTPQQVEHANKMLRMGLGSAVTGIPATLRGEPTEMQIYEYLLGGFFGYNTRPAREIEAGKYLMSRRILMDRDGVPEILDPTRSKKYSEMSKEAQDYLLFDHPVPKESKWLGGEPNSMGYGGTTGQALRYLEYKFPNADYKTLARKTLGKDATESQMRTWYGQKAGQLYKNIMDARINTPTKKSKVAPDTAMDFNDSYEPIDVNLSNVSKNLYPSAKDTFTSQSHLAKRLIEHRDSSTKNNETNTEQFISKVEKSLNRKLKPQEDKDLRSWFTSSSQPLVESMYAVDSKAGMTLAKGAHKIGTNGVSIGERHNILPLEKLLGVKLETMTHFVDRNGEAIKILDQMPDYKNGKINFRLSDESLSHLHNSLRAEDLYIYSGVKDKNQLIIAPLKRSVDGVNITKEMIWDAMSKNGYEGITPELVRKQMKNAYEAGFISPKNLYTNRKGESGSVMDARTYEDVYVSNILHHAQMHGLLPQGKNVSLLHKLFEGRYMTSASDYNKRMQLLGNKMVPLDPQSFAEFIPDGNLKTLYVNDKESFLNHELMKLRGWKDNESLSDGGIVYSQSFTDKAISSVGLPKASMFKPVHVGRSEAGTFATKSSGLRATESLQKFMDKVGVDAIVFGSSFKIKGNHKESAMQYNKDTKLYELIGDANIYNTPIRDIQISTGTFVNNNKAIRGADAPLQIWNQFDFEHKGFQEAFMEWSSKSREGSSEGKTVAENVDLDVFKNQFETNNINVRELPFEFLMKHLVTEQGNSKIGAFLFDRIQKLDLEVDTFKADTDAGYSDYARLTENIAQANINKYNSRLTLFKNDHLNMLKKFIISHYANPFVRQAGKAWLKPITPDQVQKLTDSKIKEGHVYLDNDFKNMQVSLEIPRMGSDALANINEGLTLGKLWKFHTGAEPLPKGITKQAINNALELVVIRTPSDAPSGTRVLRLGGFTNERGTGAITHSKDDFYLGGADKDSDYIKIFQSTPKKLKDIIKTQKNAKKKYLTDEKYNEKLNNMFDGVPEAYEKFKVNGVNPTDKKGNVQFNKADEIVPKMLMFDPLSRIDVAKKSSSGKSGLGHGLSSKVYLQGIIDYAMQNNGNIQVALPNNKGLLDISIKKENMQEFRDMGSMIVNKSADASSDPTLKPYVEYRRMLLDKIIKANIIDPKTGAVEPITTYKDFKKHLEMSSLKNIVRAPQAVKTNNNFRSLDSDFVLEAKADGKLKFHKDKWIVHKDLLPELNLDKGERVIASYKERLIIEKSYANNYREVPSKFGEVLMREYKVKGKTVKDTPLETLNMKDYVVLNSKIKPTKPELTDLENLLTYIDIKTLGEKSNSYAVNAVKDMASNLKLGAQGTYANRLNSAYNNFITKYINDYNMKPLFKQSKNKETAIEIEGNLRKVLQKQAVNLIDYVNLPTRKKMGNELKFDRDIGLDIFGKTLGQFSTIELLNKQSIALEKYLRKVGSKDSFKKLDVQLIKMTNKAKDALRNETDKARKQEVFDNHVIKDIETITDQMHSKSLNAKPVLDMYHTLLLSPFTSKIEKRGDTGYTRGVQEYKREVHGSDVIPHKNREQWYAQYDNLVERMSKLKQIEDPQILTERLKDIPLKDDKINPVIKQAVDSVKKPNPNAPKKGTNYVDMMAISGKDEKAIKRFKEIQDQNPVLKDNFNEFFSWFSANFGNQVPRNIKDFRMQDIYAINEFFKRSGDPSDIAFTMKFFHWDPRSVDNHLISKGIGKSFYKYTFTNPKTGEKVKVYDIMSPVGSISNYTKNVKDRGIDIDTIRLKKKEARLFEYIETLKDKDATTKELFDWRENNKQGPLSKEAKALDILSTKFFQELGDTYIYTKDAKGKRYTDDAGNWNLDKDFVGFYKDTKGNLNQYMRWKKNGAFDFENFFRKVVEVNLDADPISNIRKLVGVDGAKRYLYEMRAFNKLGKRGYENAQAIIKYRKENPFKGVGFIDPAQYMPHMNFNKTESARKAFAESVSEASQARYNEVKAKAEADGLSPKKAEELAQHAKKKFVQHMENVGNFSSEMMTVKDIADLGEKIDESVLDKKLTELGFRTSIGPLEARTANLKGYDKSHAIYNDYIDKVVGGYYKTLSAIHGDRQIQKMKQAFKDRKVPEKEAEHFNKIYKIDRRKRRRTDDEDAEVGIPKKNRRYNNYIDVWADYIKLHLQTVLGHQTYFPEQVMKEIGRGVDPLHLKSKRNLFYMTSDQNVVNLYERMWQSKKFTKVPFVRRMMTEAPNNPEARKEYFSRKIHDFGRMEAQYELMTLLANTGTYATNIFSGNIMTGASAGFRNLANAYNKKKVYDRLLTENGKEVLTTLDGKKVKSRKDLTRWMEEQGIIDNFIQHEFEYNEGLKLNLKKAGVNIKNLQRDLTKAMREKKGVRDESVMEVVKRYGVKDVMLKYGSFFMRHSEKVNRVNSYMAHALQAIEKFGPQARELSIRDAFVHEQAMKGIEGTQFLYQNSFRPMFMRTATGKVLTRFKLFAWNSIRTRREFYKQAKMYGFKEGSEEYNRAKDLFLTDMFMMALGGAFMFSIFDTSLAPPYDWIQSLADWMYGDKKERDMAFFGSKLGPANILKPPIARVPEAMGQILSGDWEQFSGYTAYTLFPFGRMARQVNQLTDDRIGRGLERAPEILVRFPYNQIQSRIERAKRRSEQAEVIDDMLGS